VSVERERVNESVGAKRTITKLLLDDALRCVVVVDKWQRRV